MFERDKSTKIIDILTRYQSRKQLLTLTQAQLQDIGLDLLQAQSEAAKASFKNVFIELLQIVKKKNGGRRWS